MTKAMPTQSTLQEHADVTYDLEQVGEEAAKGWSNVADLGYFSIDLMLFFLNSTRQKIRET